ncbi:hypothetical protein EUGRSUZ_C02625 [Eucalyptus grandis]|uniref:Uncharacterized protein n=2 Tax=Eucalyptus grandis TaxID=71139 RepID=A0ACC3LG75_EUCGR|nr:hypothetical protein EUGRSUZ_C02625 [Eucalyptus grandis]
MSSRAAHAKRSASTRHAINKTPNSLRKKRQCNTLESDEYCREPLSIESSMAQRRPALVAKSTWKQVKKRHRSRGVIRQLNSSSTFRSVVLILSSGLG